MRDRQETGVTARLCPFALLAALLPGVPRPAAAQDLTLPAQPQDSIVITAEFDSYDLPVGGWQNGTLPVERIEGMVQRRAWRLEAGDLTLLSVLVPLREQLQAQGFDILLECETRVCGGFDFRFATEVLPEPAMHVDLGDFRFLSARKGDRAASLLISRSASSVFVQMISVGPDAPPEPTAATEPAVPLPLPAPVTAPAPADIGDLAARLDQGYGVVLDDLLFASGSAALAEGDYASLTALAAWLKADPDRMILQVGHNDASGGVTSNVALSENRAQAVRGVLMSRFGVNGRQVQAQGVGPMAPRDTNATEEGRRKNRRVEAIPAPT